LNLNERQLKAIAFLKLHGRITTREYREATGASERTASRDLSAMEKLGLLDRVGATGRSAHYVISTKPAKNAPNPP
jgi:ATP-dependent DNA helicase RecG